jgi:hypothetical protein
MAVILFAAIGLLVVMTYGLHHIDAFIKSVQ